MKLSVLGTGYVGLVSGVCLAAKGHDVTCVDVREDVVRSLNAGQPHIHEAGLPELLTEVIAAGRFRATMDLNAALVGCQLVLLAVGTPSENGKIDLCYIETATRQIGEHLRTRSEPLSIVVKSTVVPGTCDTFVLGVLERSSGKKLGSFGVGMNPEFLREGNAIVDFMMPDRIVFGHDDPATLSLLEELYAPWNCDKLRVNTRTAELIKYANNCLLATQISAVNELANLAAAVGGVDVQDVLRGVHLDKRWTPILPDGRRIVPQIVSYLLPGCGFGGSCFPKDLQALRAQGRKLGLAMDLLGAVLTINDAQPAQVPAALRRHWGSLSGRRILILGLAFKPGTDDIRESASFKIMEILAREGAVLTAHDPIAMDNARRAWADLGPIDYVANWQERITEADAIIVCTCWPEYQALAESSHQSELAGKTIMDPRRQFGPADFPTAAYLSIGLQPNIRRA